MIEFLSHLRLVMAIAPVFLYGLAVTLLGLLFCATRAARIGAHPAKRLLKETLRVIHRDGP